jgi:hypothetical protein
MKTILNSTKPDLDKLPGGWEPEKVPFLPDQTIIKKTNNNGSIILENVLSSFECSLLINLMTQSPKTEKVSIYGKKDNPDDRIGSSRTSIWSVALAEQIWQKIKDHLPYRTMNEFNYTDWWQGDSSRTHWQPVMCSPLFRFMKYENSGHHYCHYDAGFIYPDDSFRTLQSVVIYLTSCKKGGATRFVKDQQDHLPVWSRNQEDWTREALEEEVISRCEAKAGKILIFDHGICHDVERNLDEQPRIIIRTDIVFKAVNAS